MLGPGIMLASVPFSVGYASHTVRKHPRQWTGKAALIISGLEALGIIAALLLFTFQA